MSKHTKNHVAKKVTHKTKHSNDTHVSVEYTCLNKILITTHSLLQTLQHTLRVQHKLLHKEKHSLNAKQKKLYDDYKKQTQTDDWLVEAYINYEKSNQEEYLSKCKQDLSKLEEDLRNQTQLMEQYKTTVMEQESKLNVGESYKYTNTDMEL
jgi:hypothetical protein